MKKDERRLMHKALDGESTKSETTRLQRRLEEDGRARAEFEQLKKVVKSSGKIQVDVPRDFTRKVLRGLGGPPPSAGGK